MDLRDIPPISDHVVEALESMSAEDLVDQYVKWNAIWNSPFVTSDTKYVVYEYLATIGNILSARVDDGRPLIVL
jgi:hypothetical protein